MNSEIKRLKVILATIGAVTENINDAIGIDKYFKDSIKMLVNQGLETELTPCGIDQEMAQLCKHVENLRGGCRDCDGRNKFIQIK